MRKLAVGIESGARCKPPQFPPRETKLADSGSCSGHPAPATSCTCLVLEGGRLFSVVPHRLSVLCSLRLRASAAPRGFPANKPINNAEMLSVPRVCQARAWSFRDMEKAEFTAGGMHGVGAASSGGTVRARALIQFFSPENGWRKLFTCSTGDLYCAHRGPSSLTDIILRIQV
jgi:hypothetical protein